MTDDLDVSLRRRLESLAAAVPVAPPGAISSVTPRAVRAGANSRLAFGGLVPVLAVLVVGTLLAGVAGIGPFAPGSSPAGPSDAVNGPIEATTRSGDFALTIRSARARYAPDEPVAIEASLTYLGGEPVQIAHAMGAAESPLGFGIEEPVLGDLQLSPTTQDACVRTTLRPRQPLVVAFEKSGGWSGDNPRSEEYLAFMQDHVLRLGDGTWHVYAVASFSLGDCSPDPVDLRVDLGIEVTPSASADTPEPSPTNGDAGPTIDPNVAGVEAVDDDGAFRLELRSGKAVYTAGEAIDIVATLAYVGAQETLDYSGGISFVGTDTSGTHSFNPGPITDMCVPRPVRDLPEDGALGDWRKVRSLPAGTWRITAVFAGSAPACTVDGSSLSVSIDIAVQPAAEPAQPIQLVTTGKPGEPSSDDFCRGNLAMGEVALDPRSGVGLALPGGDVQPIRWPFGFTAEVLPDGVILYGDRGQIVAREGQPVSYPGATASDGLLTICGQIDFP